MKHDFVKSIKVWISKLGGYLVWLLIAIFVLSTFKNLSQVSRIKGDIATEKAKIAKMQTENQALQTQILQSQGQDFIEKQIRNKLGLVKDGEAIVVLPDEDTLRKLAPSLLEDQDTLPDPTWKKWEKLFLNN